MNILLDQYLRLFCYSVIFSISIAYVIKRESNLFINWSNLIFSTILLFSVSKSIYYKTDIDIKLYTLAVIIWALFCLISFIFNLHKDLK